MAKQIIVLEQQPLTGGVSQISALFWFPVSAARAVPLPGGTSRSRLATPDENAAIAAGTVVEETFTFQIPPTATQANVQTWLQSIYANRKATFDAKPDPNGFYGRNWDGTAWVAG
jgi:hypothetical protein